MVDWTVPVGVMQHPGPSGAVEYRGLFPGSQRLIPMRLLQGVRERERFRGIQGSPGPDPGGCWSRQSALSFHESIAYSAGFPTAMPPTSTRGSRLRLECLRTANPRPSRLEFCAAPRFGGANKVDGTAQATTDFSQPVAFSDAPTASTTASTCPRVSSGNMGRDRNSRAHCSATGNDPTAYPSPA
jgi:hypothetical protein